MTCDPDGRLPHGRRALPDRHRWRRAARGHDDPRAPARRARAARPRPAAPRQRAAGPRGHVRLPRRPRERRGRRSRGRVLPQRGVLDRLRARDDRPRHLGARRGDRRAARGREPRRRRRSLRPARDRRGRSRRPRPVGHLPQRALVRLGHRRPGRRGRRRHRVRRRVLRDACASGWSRRSCRA